MSFKIIFSGAIIVCLLCLQFGDEILQWRYHDLSVQSNDLFSVLMLCFVCISTTYVFGTLLTANGDLRTLNILASIAVVLNIGLNLVFIPKWQALGSAIASLITQAFVSVTQIVITKRKFDFSVSKVIYIQFIGFILGVFALSWVCHEYIESWVLGASVFFVTAFVFALSINMIPLKKWLT